MMEAIGDIGFRPAAIAGGWGRGGRLAGAASRLALLVGLAVLAALTLGRLGDPSLAEPAGPWLPGTLIGGAAALCLLRAAIFWTDRAIWVLLGLALAARAAGEAQLAAGAAGIATPEITFADLAFVAFTALAVAALIMLVRERMLLIPGTMWLDSLLAALALTTLNTPLLAKLITASGASAAQTIVTVAHPIGDAVLLGLVIAILALPGFRPDRAEGLLIAGLALAAIADAASMLHSVDSVTGASPLLDALWPLAAVLAGLAAWEPASRTLRWPLAWRPVVMPTATAAVAVAVYVLAPTETASALGGSLAVATLAALVARMGFALVENRRLLQQAQTDRTTGLPNRGKLLADLAGGPRDVREPLRIVAVYRLTGLDSYSEAFGNTAGDALLARLARRLVAEVAGTGDAYRIGPDRLCVVIEGHGDRVDAVLSATANALLERGDGYEVGNASSVVSVPYEARDGVTALTLAEERLGTLDVHRISESRQAEVRLLRSLQERHPSLAERSSLVPELARAVGRRIGIGPDELRLLSHAAELCDIGKLELPGEILNKPGKLSSAELQAVQRHTVVAEQLIASDPALRPVARIVRSTGERYDGSGYPDGLAGNEIPLPSRIISACDAYEAMISPRPYRPPLGARQAVLELRRLAGTQFDPSVVAALSAVVDEEGPRLTGFARPTAPSAPPPPLVRPALQ